MKQYTVCVFTGIALLFIATLNLLNYTLILSTNAPYIEGRSWLYTASQNSVWLCSILGSAFLGLGFLKMIKDK